MIDGVSIKKLRVIPDERGRLMEILRSDDDVFSQFGQVYMTTVYPGVVKAWHAHKKQDDNVSAVAGMIKLVLFDDRHNSATRGQIQELFIGEHNPSLVHIPREVFHGWKCISPNEALVINVVTELFDYNSPDEIRLPYDSNKIPYDWNIKMG